MSRYTEYRVVHELGEDFATPAVFLDLWQAQQALVQKKKTYKMLGMGDKADGWRIESRTTTRTEWETVNE